MLPSFPVAPASVSFVGATAQGKVDATNINPSVVGETLSFGDYVFQYQLDGAPPLVPGRIPIDFVGGESPSDGITAALDGLGLGLQLGQEDAYIVDVQAPAVGSRWNIPFASSTPLVEVQGMADGQDATSARRSRPFEFPTF